MDKVWLKSYSKTTPNEIDLNEFDSIIELFEQSCDLYADQTAYINMGVKMTYKELSEKSKKFASFLQNELNMKKGDRLAIMMPNLLQYPITLFGAMRAGIIIVNVNPLYTARELEHQLNDSGTTAIVILENFCHVLADCIQNTAVKHVITTEIGDMFNFTKRKLVNFVVKKIKKMVPNYNLDSTISFRKALNIGEFNTFHHIKLSHRDLAFLQYTGGTTGVSKGASLSHKNMIANMQQAKAWLNFEEGNETVITALPLYHIFALTANCLVFLRLGGTNILITNPRDIPLFIKTLKKSSFSAITGVNTLFKALMNHPKFTEIDFSKLKLSLGGGMAVQEVVATKWKKLTGSTLLEAYGLTEASPAVCINPMEITNFTGSIGIPLPSTLVSIRTEKNKPCDVLQEGEICVKGPQVMTGYWNQPDETKKIFTEDGWLKTGDIATMDKNGFVRIVSRKKDMILVSGFNVYPNEIEDLVVNLEGVLECAAIGIKDEKSGERVKLCIVKSDINLTKEKIITYCKKNLTDYKQPKVIQFYDELPKTNVGKILHRALRDPEQKFATKMKENLNERIQTKKEL
jgi:long-chain acyl-CoA synthetase